MHAQSVSDSVREIERERERYFLQKKEKDILCQKHREKGKEREREEMV